MNTYILNNKDIKVVLSDLGAGIFSIAFNNEIITFAPEDIDEFSKENNYFGKTIAPITNRVKDGLIYINDKCYKLETNEGNNSLHSGNHCTCNKIWKVIEKKNKISFSLSTEDMSSGLPGNIQYEVSYELNDDNELIIEFYALSDKDTVIAMTNHVYYNLGSKSVEDLILKIPSSEYIKTSKYEMLPEILKEVNNSLDFTTPKRIGKDINDSCIFEGKTRGYDHHFELNKEDKTVTLENEKYHIELTSNFSGVQIYTENYPSGFKHSLSNLELRRGIALEPQDNILNRNIIKANTAYKRKIIYKFIKK